MTRRDALDDVLRGLAAARDAGFSAIKIDSVVVRGQNDDELGSLLEFARRAGAELRFIEYMDVGGATHWRPDAVVSAAEILSRVERTHGPATALGDRGAAPAERYLLADGTVFGVIASTTRPFCRACDRGRLTADGQFFTCLYGREKLDLRAAVRDGVTDEELAYLVAARWQVRSDRGAELRASLADRAPLVPLSALRRDPHLEMHTRGG